MPSVKKSNKYDGEPTVETSGFNVDMRSKKEIRKEERADSRQEREDKKDMIPARFRNRGQAGLDAYVAKQRAKKARKNATGLARIFGTSAARSAASKSRKAARQAKRRMSANKGAGCQGKGCGAYE
jgi:hypothetical protein